MSSRYIGIEEARKSLGTLVTAVLQGTDVVLTRNGKPAARIVRYQEEPMITMAELAAHNDMSRNVRKFAGMIGALTEHDPRTGQLPKRWTGQGMDVLFTHAEADEITAEWRAGRHSAEIAWEDNVTDDPEVDEVVERYRP